jgi:uncharacterized membrane protein YfcA
VPSRLLAARRSGRLGRVDAALTIAVTVPQTASIALGAALVAVVDYRLLLAVMAAVLVISVVYLMGGPGAVAPARAAPVPCETAGLTKRAGRETGNRVYRWVTSTKTSVGGRGVASRAQSGARCR